MPSFSVFSEVELALEAVEGGYSIRFQNGETPLYQEERPGAPWESAQIQAELGNKLYDALDEERQEQLNKEWVKEQVEGALQGVGRDLETDEELQASLQSPILQKVLTATEAVDIYPGDPTRYVVTLRGREVEFTPSEINGGPGVLQNAWLNNFPTDRIQVSSDDWNEITEEWLENAEIHEEETATEDSLLVEGLIQYLRPRITPYDTKDALKGGTGARKKTAGYWDPDGEKLSDEEGPVCWVRSTDIEDYLNGEEGRGIGDLGPLSKSLRRAGHLKESSKQFRVGGGRVRVWPFSPETLGIEEDQVVRYSEEGEEVEL